MTVAELRLQTDAPATLTFSALAQRLRCKPRTAQWKIARWRERWLAWEELRERDPSAPAPRMPRVLRVKVPGRAGRPAHVVCAASFERWRRYAPVAS